MKRLGGSHRGSSTCLNRSSKWQGKENRVARGGKERENVVGLVKKGETDASKKGGRIQMPGHG